MKIIKTLLWIFVIIIVLYAIYMTYIDIVKNIPQEKKKTEKFQENKLKIVLYHASWCGHCVKYLKANTFMNTYDSLSTQNKYDKVVFVQLDFDKNKDTATKYNINSFPTIVAISSNGDLVNTFNGDRNDPIALEQFTSDSLLKI